MYESPITMYMDKLYRQMDIDVVDGVFRAVLNCNIEVNKAELLRALEYDRGQYENGHADGLRIGYELRDNEIVRCKDCKHFTEGMAVGMCKRIPDRPVIPMMYNDFCSRGERRDSDG